MDTPCGTASSPASRVLRRTPAKINLWLEVVRKREDGYHDLSSLMLPVGVWDELEVSLTPGEGIRLRCEPEGLACDGSNLAWRAAEGFLRTAGRRTGVEMVLRKHIPVGAGMGGGSSDAAAVLLGLDELMPGDVPYKELLRLALGLGADVPFFLSARPALATGVGERLDPVEGVPEYPLVLVKPGVEVSTAHVYRNLRLTRGESRIKLRAFMDRPWDLEGILQNDLESVTVSEHPEVGAIKEWLVARGALGALMSGSGPTVFGVFKDWDVAARIAEEAGTRWSGCWVAATRVIGPRSA